MSFSSFCCTAPAALHFSISQSQHYRTVVLDYVRFKLKARWSASSMAQVVDTELISEDELRSSAGAASRFERRTTVSFNFFRFSPVLENSLLADAPTPPAPLCRLHFRPFLTWAPLVFARRQWWYNYVLPCIILWFMITLMFFDFQVRVRHAELAALPSIRLALF